MLLFLRLFLILFFVKIAKKIEEEIRDENYALVIASTDDNSETELRYLKSLYKKRVDGIVISSTGGNEDYLVKLNKKITIICIDRRPVEKNLNSVYVDKEKATFAAVNYLSQRNHEKIALITGTKLIITNYDRYIGYIKGIYENNITLNDNYIKFGKFSVKFGQKSLVELLSLEENPTVVITGNSFITAGILLKAREKKIFISKDLSLISFGDISNSKLITPKLTLVDEKINDIGEKASELLLSNIKNGSSKIKQIKIETKINDGKSSRSL